MPTRRPATARSDWRFAPDDHIDSIQAAPAVVDTGAAADEPGRASARYFAGRLGDRANSWLLLF
jgi:hypothetical protein